MSNHKILIVDDSKTMRMQVKDMLPKGNFDVLEAKDGVEGLEAIIQDHPNLVLLDFFMPRMNGWEVIQKIQDHPKLKQIPVVLMSGRREDVEKAVPQLFDYFEFLSKPFEAEVLIQAIKQAMMKAKQRRQVVRFEQFAQSEQAIVAMPDTVASTQPATSLPTKLSPIPTAAPQEIEALKAEIQQLQTRNANLEKELAELKKQVVQIMAFMRQKVK